MASFASERPDSERRASERAHLFRRFWRTALGYWRRGGPRLAWPLTLSMTAVVLVSLAITYGINLWNRHFFDALEAKNAGVALHQGLLFPLWIAAYLALCVFAMWVRLTMQRTWRAFVNDRILDRWLAGGRYYHLECIGGDHRNPEHRINDDLRLATEMPVDFASGFVTAVLSAITFFTVLWSVGGSITVTVGVNEVVVPGFMLIAAVIYALVANGAMLAIGRRFIPLTEAKNQAEAEYRYALTRVRENAESIALLRGDAAERAQVDGSFSAVLARWRDLVGQYMRTVIVSQGSAQLVGIVPVLLCAPRYLDGTMTLGQVMQIASAFTIVQSALSWPVDNYTRIADWTASVRRVAALLTALDRLDDRERLAAGRIRQRAAGDHALRLRGLRVSLAEGVDIVGKIDAKLRRREKVLLVGDSGTGKSALIRALGGCWPWGQGEVCRRPGTEVCVVPQRPYVPPGSLRQAIAYPLTPQAVDERAATEALGAVGLGAFLPRLDEDRAWSRTLSEGEKQRLAFARLLVHRPDVIVLDEATSALHVAAQAELMRLLAEKLPDATVLSAGHRPELEAFHGRKLTLSAGPGGARIVKDELIVREEDVRLAPASPRTIPTIVPLNA